MRSSVQSRRQRGVTLTEEGLERLTFARAECEQREREGRRFTHDELEAITGLATRTLSRVFDGSEPVDRRTLERAFGGLGLTLRRTDYETCNDPEPPRGIGTNLPPEFTAFLGREREIAEVETALSIGRLLTLCGPGGVGKTRIALRVARGHVALFRDGVCFADLSACVDQGGLAPVLTASFGLQDTESASAESALFRLLSDKTALLVLDNCEQLRQPIAALTQDLLHRCPGLKIVATSREPLGVPAESVYRVAPLTVPPPNVPLAPEHARQFDAVRFFEERAAAFVDGYMLSAETLPPAREICRRLEGIPLALELACAQLRTVGIAETARQLSDRLELLRSTSDGAPDRQKTLLASFEWSYALLTNEERMLLRVLCVFAAGWSVEAATTIVRNLNLPIGNVAAVLGRLGAKSFITKHESDLGDRYTMLQVTREHLLASLQTLERESILHAHAEYFAGYAMRITSSAVATSQLLSTQRLNLETDELRTALHYTVVEGNDLYLGARLAIALTRWWLDSGRWSEGRHWFDLIRVRASALDDATRGRVIYGSSLFATYQRDPDVAEPCLMEALACFDACSDVEGFASALNTVALLWRNRGRGGGVESFRGFRIFADAVVAASAGADAGAGLSRALDFEHRLSEALLRISLQCFRTAGNRLGEGNVLQSLGTTLLELDEDLEAATRLCERAAMLYLETHRERSMASSYALFSQIAASRGDYSGAIAYLESAVPILVDFGNEPFANDCLCILGAYATLRDDFAAASTYYRDALENSAAVAYDPGVLWSIEGSARLAAAIGEKRPAIQLSAYAAKRRATRIFVETPLLDARREAFLASLQSSSTTIEFADCWTLGAAWTEHDAIAEATRIFGSRLP